MLSGALPPELPGTLSVAVPGVLEQCPDEVLPLASVGKLLLLAEVARGLGGGDLHADEPVDLLDEDYCGGSGLLTRLSARRWTVADLATLTAAVSDNTATNALIRRVGLARINEGAEALGLVRTRLLDRIREPRLPQHPHTFAVGTAAELAALAERIAGDEPWARVVLGWMAACSDRSMVPALIPHDPEDSSVPDIPRASPWVANKTGVDVGIRCDVGVVRGSRQVCYAVLGRSAAGSEFPMTQAMRAVGARIAAAVS
ncbi:beta-lactamase class A [Actinacidiphila yanglinensis]|uniref:Beta-lactamase class A n=1 Tax=Actinacidiphila yanglinensis TaxID=310779 RepID=A0A1H6DSM5_9ACTN|nr:serine hydrolase [Actinacidiphila yanglinensis]SEG87716.1 beta-lactamase class A [Actinacidiphila yanglinensis]